MRTVKFGLIGCGRISQTHFKAFSQIDHAKIITCADIKVERAKKAKETYKLETYYEDYNEMLSKEDIDAVLICTPSGTHPQIGIDAAKNKIHVISEKPIGIKLNEADRLIKACDENKVHLFVIKQNRLNTTMQLLKKAIEKKRFGKIYMVQSNVFWQRPQNYYAQAKWRGTWEFDGGAFTNQASHYVDALYWLIGPVDYVMAETATMAREIEAEDSGAAILKFRNGAIGTLNVTMLAYPKNFEGSITIIGEKGTVKLGGMAVNKIEKWEFENYDDDDKIVFESNYSPKNVYGLGHIPYFKNVVNTLLNEAEAFTDGREGRKSLEIIRAIYKSNKLGKKIAIPLEF